MSAVGLAAETMDVEALERQAREHGDAVIALLPVDRGMRITKARETLERKGVVRAFGFLQAQHVGSCGFQEFGDQIDAQADGIDIPGGDFEGHGPNLRRLGRICQRSGRVVPDQFRYWVKSILNKAGSGRLLVSRLYTATVVS